MQRKNKKITIIHSNLYSAFIVYKSFLQSITYIHIHIGIRSSYVPRTSYLVPRTSYLVPRAVYGGQYIRRPAHQTYTRMHIKRRRIQPLFLRRIPPSQRRISIRARMHHITITLSLCLSNLCGVQSVYSLPPPYPTPPIIRACV